MTQTITALFDNTAEAEAAQAKLVSADISQSAIRIVRGSQGSQISGSTDRTRDEGGFWESLKDLFFPKEDRYSYGGACCAAAARC